ncbi:MAG: hypothetical protein EON98_07355 [Chitinophagaceae bacterium]|nr:MAG: hypothetical protein EON98_07355 [Chitinophagaceae bacterium]
MIKAAQQNKVLVLCWFTETLDRLAEHFTKAGASAANLSLAQQIRKQQTEGSAIIFAEHFPIREKEGEVYERLQLKEATVYSALDEPLLKRFGGEKIISLVKNLGANEDEAIQHSVISSSIRNAQNKLKQKVSIEQHATSQEAWMRTNAVN